MHAPGRIIQHLNYRSCLSIGKVGGDITVTYQVKILQTPAAPLVNRSLSTR